MIDRIQPILDEMTPITLEEMRNIHLMDRVDSKFVAPVSSLPLLLKEMTPFFKVQINNDKLIAPYSTQYLDTSDLDMYVMHQNGKLNRQKIRIRTYINSGVSFLEVKNKNNKGRTKKVRVPVDTSHILTIGDLEKGRSFLEENSLFEVNRLEPSLANEFNRITLVNNRATERVTIDFALSFLNYKTRKKKDLEHLVILELKQDGWQNSDFLDVLMQMRIKKLPFSKYCMGTVITNPEIKYNRFKDRWAIINKYTHPDYNL